MEAIVDFLIWASLMPGLLFATWGGVFNVWQRAVAGSGMIMCDSSPDFFSKVCSPELYRIGALELAGIVFAVPVLMLHVFLFTHGVIERCGRFRLSKRAQMIKDLEDNTYTYNNGHSRYP
ncbi:hypothetical protein UA08_09073 [Talaromyces atroroseus]|uniref:Uncharacterized protein n=1 Tax=Talaromyces atroroseus TaxID=1441469 RepID=A0A1Q5Q7R2_TALAT|nr:hypothetical protein UA08_09073 [Talaromyces atroroseus]OKL55711.1 hypothetical protein UA08_09073 [Talaromyces atroroseus]